MRRTAALLALLAASVGTACQAAGERLAEEGLEKAIQIGDEGITDVEVDADGDGVRINTDEGSIEVGQSEIPDDFPTEVPLPDFDVNGASRLESEGDLSWSLTGTYDGTLAELDGFFSSRLGSGGWTTEQTMTQADSFTYAATGNGYSVIASGIDQGGTIMVTIVVTTESS